VIVLDPPICGTHSLCRTKATIIYMRTSNPRAVQFLLGRTWIEIAVRFLGVAINDAPQPLRK